MSAGAAWVLLVLSGLTDVAWVIATKKANGFREPMWALASLFLLALFVTMLTRALTVLPLGVAYGVWVGIGALGSMAAGIAFFGEPLAPARLAYAGLIVLGVAGLKLSAS